MSSMHELSNMSYTNKDFNSIYTELLEYAKSISYRWDPTISDESDPGVVLLKLAAIIGDKDNYNIDQNVLELMPASVSQLPAAKQIFDQCGYSLKYYQAATGFLSVTIVKNPFSSEDSNDASETELTDEQLKDTVFTIPMFTMFSDIDSSVVYTTIEDHPIKYREQTTVNVIQGVATDYTINNDSRITTLNLDSKNRLYFNDLDIAENGIFITNIGEKNYEDWVKVDNLETQPKGSLCYKFGLSLSGTSCYIQFPDDIEFLMGEGIQIKYVKTSGKTGNIPAGRIKQFYVSTKFNYKPSGSTESVEIDIPVDCIKINNPFPINNGANPETVDEAYKSYKRVKDTFETLVSLKDYTDYMMTSTTASNGYVTDRTNDIQHAWKVSVIDGSDQRKERVKDGSMTAFDLCIYALQYVGDVNNESTFRSTFKLVEQLDTSNNILQGSYAKLLDSNDSIKSLQHDYKGFDAEKILLIKNKYPIISTIIPRYKLSATEQYDVADNVRLALYSKLNSKQLSFGDPASYDLIYDTINSADERIKAVSVNSITYETYAVYKSDNGLIEEIRVDDNSTAPSTDNEKSLWNKFRAEIFAKNVLAGITPLYDKYTQFNYSANQSNSKIIKDISNLTTETTITCTPNGDRYSVSDELAENERILLTAPNLIEETNYSNYVKFVYSFSSDKETLKSNEAYELKGEDFIIFFWKASETDTDYTYVKYTKDSDANIVVPSFQLLSEQVLPKTDNNTEVSPIIFNELLKDKTGLTGNISLRDGTSITEYIKKNLTTTSNISNSNNLYTRTISTLTGTSTIYLKRINEIFINNKTNGSKYLYWLLNRAIKDGNKDCYDLGARLVDNVYTLQTGEYFMYANDAKTTLHLLGEGTKIEVKNFSSDNLKVKAITYEELSEGGIDAITDWYNVALSTESDAELKFYATEMQRILLSEGATVSFKLVKTPSSIPVVIDNTPLEVKEIQYQDASGITSVPDLDILGENWEITSILNLNVSSDVPQKLSNNQTIKYSDNDSDILTDCYIQTNRPLQIVGGKNLDVTSLKGDKLNILTYKLPDNASTSFVVSLGPSITTEFKLLRGNYIIQMTCEDGDVESDDFTIGLSDADGSCVPLNSSTVKLVLSADKQITLTNNSINKTIFIQPLYRYTNELISNIDFSKTATDEDTTISTFEDCVLDRIDSLTTSKSEQTDPGVADANYKFNYIQNITNPIKNPLISETFVDSRHFYNKFTICEWQEKSSDGSDLSVVTTVK